MASRTGWVTMRRLMIGLLVGAMSIIVGCSASAPTGPAAVQTTVHQLSPTEFAAQTPERVTINVHIPNEGSLPDTDLTIPYNQISARQAELPQDKSAGLAVYCMTGNMSAIAVQTLTELGYTDVVELRGGMQAWQVAGLPFIKPG